ncbi:MFS transporter [Williamsia sterculiae]|uniref:Drug resistance transporter, EmrB/QacA subfamily n=1 Tax=Williamsia sterculiae TaxID=1344003 RepID=A0A1N7CD83_9NOCA|nr:MFS transporter [Williamsia sterculiae]SIR61417.1 drug resistance transporter, EmrB/QacA subfamily [Williamsia sterculiae]
MPDHTRRSRLLLPVVLSAIFMYGFDLNVVNVAIPSVQDDLHAGDAALELVVGGYAFAYAAGLITGGRLGDLLSYRRMFLLGMTGFIVASVLCGLARNPTELVVARLLQGAAAAVMVPQVLSLIMSSFEPDERTKALAWFGVTAGVSGVFGQVLGGLLISADIFGWGWRVIFFLNLPVGLVVVVLAARVLSDATRGRETGLDPIGLVGMTAALSLALAPLAFGREQGWPAWTWICLVVAVPVLAVVVGYERRLAARGRDPLIDLTLFRPVTNVALLVNVAFMATFTSGIFALTLLFQQGLGLSAMQAGLSFGPMAVCGVLAPMVGKRLIAAHGHARTVQIGCLVDAIALLLLAVALDVFGGQTSLPWLITGLAVLGAGNTLILPAVIGATVATVQPHQAGAASGTLNTVQQFAGAAGLATIGTAFFTLLGPHPDRDDYADATQAVVWVDLALVAVMAALTVVLARPPRTRGTTSEQPFSDEASTSESVP